MNDEDRSLDLAMNERGMLRELIKTPGWGLLMQIAEAQTTVKINGVMLTPCTLDEGPKQEFTKGEVAGIMLFQQMPGNAIDALSAEIYEHKKKLGLNDEDEEKDDANSSAP